MLIKELEGLLNIEGLKEDARKLGINFITAGIAALFIAHSANLTLWTIIGSLCVIIIGAFSITFGLYQEAKK